MLGAVLGFVLSCGVFTVLYLLDDVVHNEDYVRVTFDLPLLAVVPDLTEKNSKATITIIEMTAKVGRRKPHEKYRNAASDYEYGAMLGENLNFAASEAYKLLRTNLDFCAFRWAEMPNYRNDEFCARRGQKHHHTEPCVFHCGSRQACACHWGGYAYAYVHKTSAHSDKEGYSNLLAGQCAARMCSAAASCTRTCG